MSSENIQQSATPLLRSRSINLIQDSPSSITISESASFHQTDDVAVRAHAFLPTRKITIRSDPALLTCFDAADKPLYNLWAPKT